MAAIHELADAGGSHVLVLELVEGETLAERLRGGAPPPDEALAIAKQIADALAAAHERGIVHRDLKPANIKIAPDGCVKVLDFGLAKIAEPTGPSQSPTVRTATGLGVILGTAAYMAPEQAKGRAVDRRADVWAFGCVLYEILAGQAAFAGDSTTEILTDVLTREPSWERLPVSTPPPIRRLLRRCLEKNPARRLHDMSDARLEIEEAELEPAGVAPSVPRRRADRLGWIGAAVCLVVAFAAFGLALRPEPLPPEMRVEINVAGAFGSISPAIAPNGEAIVVEAFARGQRMLWLRPFGAIAARPLPGTGGATAPF